MAVLLTILLARERHIRLRFARPERAAVFYEDMRRDEPAAYAAIRRVVLREVA